ncbi:aspartate/glutamate racemase family protein [Tabrizicola sp.]|uniref:aspartate/glutamate racemase family protein n=1 Tax=Tabrizicola sp. TaxID=2005166 RepID=UPI002615DE8A|nr:aspartate/glutamate racemase family protein [Tabrizicola sp.]MDM7933639.1 aspartate/glutamate racemase family protein [Tabrizicola sp.]
MRAYKSLNNDARATIGIVTGSGPEAGLDLWAKILRRNQAAIGPGFRGDLDAPRVVVVSEPDLGLSMDLAANDAAVWAAMQKSLAALAPLVDAYAIACNTLNWYAPRIADLDLGAELVSFQSVLADWIARSGTRRLALLGAGPVTEMGEWSAYRGLADLVEVELPADPHALHHLIEDVKRLGSADAGLRLRFAKLVKGLDAQVVLLACTELPLIADIETERTLVDVTELVAEALVVRSLAGRTGRNNQHPQQQE